MRDCKGITIRFKRKAVGIWKVGIHKGIFSVGDKNGEI